MSKQIDLILHEDIVKEIVLLQGILSNRDGKKWDFSETCQELIRFCIDEEYRSSENMNSLLLNSFFAKKGRILENMRDRILISTIHEDFYYLNC